MYKEKEGVLMLERFLLNILAICLVLVGGCSDSSDSSPVAQLTAPPSDCLWVLLVTPATEEVDNVYRPDLNIFYAVAIFQLPENALYFTLENQFPYARLMSMTSSDVLGGLDDYLIDTEITPELGSTNPFMAGNNRNDPSRIFRVTVTPKGEQQNTIPGNAENILLTRREVARILYRIYVPNNGDTIWGNVGLPRVTLYMADGSILQGEEACNAMNLYEPGIQLPRAPQWTANEYAAARKAVDPSKNPPKFRATWDYRFIKQCDFGGDCDSLPFDNATEQAGDASNLYTFLSREHGAVLAIRGKLPETPMTSNGEDIAVEGQLRYWSICSYEYYSQKAFSCLYDEQVQVNDDGYYTIVLSRDEDLPSNATHDCGVSHLGWSENGDGFSVEEGRENFPNDGFIYVRNVVPSAGFTQVAPLPNTLDEEGQMEDYIPKGRYFSKAEFEGLGCNPWLALPYADL